MIKLTSLHLVNRPGDHHRIGSPLQPNCLLWLLAPRLVLYIFLGREASLSSSPFSYPHLNFLCMVSQPHRTGRPPLYCYLNIFYAKQHSFFIALSNRERDLCSNSWGNFMHDTFKVLCDINFKRTKSTLTNISLKVVHFLVNVCQIFNKLTHRRC